MTLFQTSRDHTDCPACKLKSSMVESECCPPTAGPFSARRKFDLVDGKYVPRPCCAKNLAGAHAGPFGAPRAISASSDHEAAEILRSKPSAEVDGYGWPTADYRPWGETEKVIDEMVAAEGPWTIGDPFGLMDDYPQPGPLGLVYLAGPMRGVESFNFPAFHNAAKGLREKGWGVFNPAEFDEMGGFDATGLTGDEDLTELGFSLRNALGKDLAFITGRADAVAVLPGWEDSKGARAEVATARALGLPVFDALEGASRPIVAVDPAQPGIVTRWVEPAGDVNRVIEQMKGSIRMFAETYEGPAFVRTDGEVRTTSSTGGQKGVKPEQYDQIPTKALAELARHFGAGARKYKAHNFRAGYEWSKCYNALIRHAMAFWGGEDYDVHKDGCPADCTDHLPESKHIIAVAWHALALATFMDEHPEFDDRYKPEGDE